MTLYGGHDLTGLNLYNENGGVVQGRVCGQGLMTKLLGSSKKGNKINSLPSQGSSTSHDKEGKAICLTPGKSKKIKFHRSNLYAHMNMSSIDTESCSSEELFSETTSTGSSALSAALNDLQSPAFVAQFDPLQLETDMRLNPTLQQQVQPDAASNSEPRKAGALSWSASLPAVVEEGSKSFSEQGSPNQQQPQQQRQMQYGIWRCGEDADFSEEDEAPEDEQRAVLGHKEHIIKQQGDPHEALSLHESDRIESPPTIPHGVACASPPAISHSPGLQDVEDRGAEDNRKTSKSRRHDRKTKLSKEQSMKEAVDQRIRQAMEEATLPTESEDASGLESMDSDASFMEQNRSHMFDPFTQRAFGSCGLGKVHSAVPTRDRCPPEKAPAVSDTMQALLVQQQMTLKEMSAQNSHYRRELQECQDIFGKWRLERDQQKSTIQDLAKEKDAYATEASFLRNEMSSIRLELETLRKETRLQAGSYQNMQSPQQPHDLHHQKQSPYKEGSSMDRAFRHQQPQLESPFNAGSLMPGATFQYQQFPSQQSPFKESSPERSPPPPPRSNTPASSNNQEFPSPSLMGTKQEKGAPSPNPRSGKKDKSLPSGLLRSSTSNSAKKHHRSVKFQDPPKSREWTMFPVHMNDDSLLECSYQDSVLSTGVQGHAQSRHLDTCEEIEDRQEHVPREEEQMQVNVHAHNEGSLATTTEEQQTPIAANMRAAAGVDVVESGQPKTSAVYKNTSESGQPKTSAVYKNTSAYKNRLAAIQQQRQHRVGNTSTVSIASSSNGNPEKKKRRSRPPVPTDRYE